MSMSKKQALEGLAERIAASTEHPMLPPEDRVRIIREHLVCRVPHRDTETPVEDAKALLKSRRYAVVKDSTYRRNEQRRRDALAEADAAQERTRSVERWAEKTDADAKRLAQRCSDLVAFAVAHGATLEDLSEFNRNFASAHPQLNEPLEGQT